MISVFLSYRREDSRADAGRLYDRLSAEFGDECVFMDIDDIQPGDNFVATLNSTLSGCDLLLTMIGPRWHNLIGPDGRIRLAAPDDFVRIEVETALSRGIPVIPVLVGGASMPSASELPDSLAPLLQRQALELSDKRYHEDVGRLCAAIRKTTRRSVRPARARWIALALTTLAAAAVAYWFLRGPQVPALRAAPAIVSAAQAKALLVTHDFYDAGWNAAGAGTANRFDARVAGEGVVVVDHATGLMWQKSGSRDAMTRERVPAYLDTLNRQRFAGYDDWRTPTLEEAYTLLENVRHGEYHIDPALEAAGAFMMMTSDTLDGERPWVMYFYDGYARPAPAGFNASVRAVRRLR